MLVAVYGTLRYGEPANIKLRGCKRIGQDALQGVIYHMGGFPGLKFITDDDPRTVVVDVYQVPKDMIDEITTRLDYYEGYFPAAPDQSLFVRRQGRTTEGCLEVTYYEYKWEVDDALEIKSGDWIKR